MTQCTKAVEGWFCIREAGHEGPCAAVPKRDYGGPPIPAGHLRLVMAVEFEGRQFECTVHIPKTNLLSPSAAELYIRPALVSFQERLEQKTCWGD